MDLKKRMRLPIPRGAEETLTYAGGLLIAVFMFIAIFPSLIAPYSPTKMNPAITLKPPTFEHIMGTDYLGRDVFSRVVYGTRTAIIVAFMSVVTSLFLGVTSGLVAGYYGGKMDRILTFIMDTVYAFPGLLIAIMIVAMLGPSITNMVISLSFWYVPNYYRVTRGEVLSVKERVFVEAAEALGASNKTIILSYILPNIVSSLVVLSSLNAADAILSTASLGFLGLGIPPPTPDWGTDLHIGFTFLQSGMWWIMTFPGLMIMLITLGLNFVGEGLSEMLNPELRMD